jgi:hypothetical protein
MDAREAHHDIAGGTKRKDAAEGLRRVARYQGRPDRYVDVDRRGRVRALLCDGQRPQRSRFLSRLFCRVYNDREQFGDYFSAILKDWEMVYYKVDDLIAQGNRVAAVCDVSWRYKATGKTIAVKKVDIWKFDEAGRATDFFETFDTATVLAATQPG